MFAFKSFWILKSTKYKRSRSCIWRLIHTSCKVQNFDEKVVDSVVFGQCSGCRTCFDFAYSLHQTRSCLFPRVVSLTVQHKIPSFVAQAPNSIAARGPRRFWSPSRIPRRVAPCIESTSQRWSFHDPWIKCTLPADPISWSLMISSSAWIGETKLLISKQKLEFGLPCYINIFPATRAAFIIFEPWRKWQSWKEQLMHVYKIVHKGEFNKNGNLHFTRLFYAWLQILKRDLHGNENLRRRIFFYHLGWKH